MPLPQLNLRDLRRSDLPEGRYDLNRSPVRIGRGPRCEIRLHTDRIADVQVILRREGDRWLIHPVGPPEGSILNGLPMTEAAWLDYGTTLLIGHVEIKLNHAESGLIEPAAVITPEAVVEPMTPEPEREPEFVPHIPEVVAEIVAEEPDPVVLEVAEIVADDMPESVVLEPEPVVMSAPSLWSTFCPLIYQLFRQFIIDFRIWLHRSPQLPWWDLRKRSLQQIFAGRRLGSIRTGRMLRRWMVARAWTNGPTIFRDVTEPPSLGISILHRTFLPVWPISQGRSRPCSGRAMSPIWKSPDSLSQILKSEPLWKPQHSLRFLNRLFSQQL